MTQEVLERMLIALGETPNNGSYIWIPSGVLAGKDNYFMAICDAGVDDCTYTFNGRFEIDDAGALSSPSSSAISRLVTSFPVTATVLPWNIFADSLVAIQYHPLYVLVNL